MAGCVEMAGVIAQYENEVYGKVESDLCESCAEYLAEDLAKEVKLTPYANKGLLQKN
jgi:hypothetical protein